MMFRVLLFSFCLWVIVNEWEASKQRHYLKCDQRCMNQRQYPKVIIDFTRFPIFSCGCEGHRMPDDYLRRK